jgi:prevent-host-death family protein
MELVKVGVYDAKTRLSELLVRVEAGDQVVITRQGRPIARLVPYEAQAQPAS